MAYFPDMTPYVYFPTGEKALNIGWLDQNHPFPTGEVDELFWNRLVEIITHQRVMVTLGSHPCPFCPVPPGITRDDAEEIPSGSAEIRVQGKNV